MLTCLNRILFFTGEETRFCKNRLFVRMVLRGIDFICCFELPKIISVLAYTVLKTLRISKHRFNLDAENF